MKKKSAFGVSALYFYFDVCFLAVIVICKIVLCLVTYGSRKKKRRNPPKEKKESILQRRKVSRISLFHRILLIQFPLVLKNLQGCYQRGRDDTGTACHQTFISIISKFSFMTN